MGEKIKIPFVTDTVLVDGVYIEERRSNSERRSIKRAFVQYERRHNSDPRSSVFKSINIRV